MCKPAMVYCAAAFLLPLFCSLYSNAVYLQDRCISENNVVCSWGDTVSLMPGFMSLFIPLYNLPPAPSSSSCGCFLRVVNPIRICPVSSVTLFKLRLLFTILPTHFWFFFSIEVNRILLRGYEVVNRKGSGKEDGWSKMGKWSWYKNCWHLLVLALNPNDRFG